MDILKPHGVVFESSSALSSLDSHSELPFPHVNMVVIVSTGCGIVILLKADE